MNPLRFLLPATLYFATSLSLPAVYVIADRVEVQGGLRVWYDSSKPYHVNSFVFGWQSESGSAADYALALGYRASADGWAAVALGHEVVADDHHAVAIGYESTAGDEFSTAIGFRSDATRIRSFVFGANGLAAANESMALGFGVDAGAYRSVVVGSFNATETSDDTAWDPGDAVFVVGNGENAANRSNALIVRKNGQATLENKFWDDQDPTVVPTDPDASDGEALVVKGHTRLEGRVVFTQPQGDISMGPFTE